MNEQPTPVKVIFTNRELHMMGDIVAVCWNLNSEHVSRVIDGIQFSGKKKTRTGTPYIDFVDVRTDGRTGEVYEDEDSPVEGGISPEYAADIVKELQRAIEYIKTVQ